MMFEYYLIMGGFLVLVGHFSGRAFRRGNAFFSFIAFIVLVAVVSELYNLGRDPVLYTLLAIGVLSPFQWFRDIPVALFHSIGSFSTKTSFTPDYEDISRKQDSENLRREKADIEEDLKRQKRSIEEQLLREAEKLKQEREAFQRERTKTEEKKLNPANYADACEILGISQSSTLDEAKRAKRALSARYHPDKVVSMPEYVKKDAQDKIIEINAAFDTFKQRH